MSERQSTTSTSKRKKGGANVLARLVSRPNSAKKEDETEVEPGAYSPLRFDPGLNLIAELRTRYDVWKEPTHEVEDRDTGEMREVPVKISRVDVWSLPDQLQTPVEAISAQAFPGNPAGTEASTAVIYRIAVTHGVEALYSHPVVEKARQVRKDYYGTHISEITDADQRELIAAWLRVAHVEITIAGGSKKSTPIYVTEETKNELANLRRELGVSVSSLTVLCLALTLCQQPDNVAHPVLRNQWAELVADFLRALDTRAEGTDALVRRFTRKAVRTKAKGTKG